MNRINPEKLQLSKWTAVEPRRKEKHFIVSKLIRSDENRVLACELEAVISRRVLTIDWRELRDEQRWMIGWK